jgi:tRNA pseudouridine55 synthase
MANDMSETASEEVGRREIENMGESGLVIPIYKPRGVSSFEVVREVRNELRVKKVGHSGTLDPLAEGLLIILTGKKTKLMSEFLKLDKEYLATFRLGVTSRSYDLETEVVEQTSNIDFSESRIREVLEKYTGRIEQVPPEYSAAWIDGKRAYNLARRGVKFELKPKTVSISELTIKLYAPPFLKVEIVCSSGTYIRSLARDIGRDLGSGAILTELVRTRIGSYYADKAIRVAELSSQQNALWPTRLMKNGHERNAA